MDEPSNTKKPLSLAVSFVGTPEEKRFAEQCREAALSAVDENGKPLYRWAFFRDQFGQPFVVSERRDQDMEEAYQRLSLRFGISVEKVRAAFEEENFPDEVDG